LDGIGYGPPGHSGSFDLKFKNVAAVWRTYSEAGASAFVVSGLRVVEKDVLDCAAAVPGPVATTVVLTVTSTAQQERILARANTRYGAERGGGSSAQTPKALAQVVDQARQQLEDEADEIPGALVLHTVGVPVVEIARQLLRATGGRPAKPRLSDSLLEGHSGTLAQAIDLRPELEQPGGRLAKILKDLDRFIHLIGLRVAELMNPNRRREEQDQRQRNEEPECVPPPPWVPDCNGDRGPR
jgi:hypothetical protein